MRMTKIIVIEGIDGSGKSVQQGLLTERLKADGYRVAHMSFPRYDTFFGAQVGRYLRGDGVRADEVDSRSMCLWYAMDRFKAFEDFKDGEADFLILNRYVVTNAVYQSVRAIDSGLPDNWPWVKELEHVQLGLPLPDLYVIVDVDPAAAQHNVDRKGQREYIASGVRDVYEEQQGLLSRARQRYLDIASKEDNFEVIQCMVDGCMEPPETIANKVWGALCARGLVGGDGE